MKYELTDYQGNKLMIDDTKAKKIADIAGLIEVDVNGQTHYVNKANIANIRPIRSDGYKTLSELGLPNLGVGDDAD